MNVAIYKSGIGLNNKIAPHRLPFKEGITALEDVSNMLVSQSGDLVTRKGSTFLISGEYHSPWKVGSGFLVVKDDEMFLAIPDVSGALSFTLICSGLRPNVKMFYTEELDGSIYYSNGHDMGMIRGTVRTDWTTSIWRLTDRDINKVRFKPCKHLAILSGRIVGAIHDELIFTEYGLFGLYDEVANVRRFEYEITMVCSVRTGLYVSDSKATYFLSGTNPHDWTMKKVLDYPAYAHNPSLVNPSELLGMQTSELSCLMATIRGPVVGLPDGTVINLIEKNVKLPECGMQGSIMLVDETMILQSQ